MLALLGDDFLRKPKVDILTSANRLLIQNVPIITHMHKSRKTIKVILNANSTIEILSKNIFERQTDEQEAQLMSEDSFILEPQVFEEDKLGVLIARGLVTPAISMPIRALNVSNRLVNLKAGMKVKDLLPIETNEQQLSHNANRGTKRQPISEIIDSYLIDKETMLTINVKEELAKLLF